MIVLSLWLRGFVIIHSPSFSWAFTFQWNESCLNLNLKSNYLDFFCHEPLVILVLMDLNLFPIWINKSRSWTYLPYLTSRTFCLASIGCWWENYEHLERKWSNFNDHLRIFLRQKQNFIWFHLNSSEFENVFYYLGMAFSHVKHHLRKIDGLLCIQTS